jgi:hypothetical protein
MAIPYAIDTKALEAARDFDFEHMMWYAYYVITEDESEEEEVKAAYKEQIEEIISAAAFHGYEKRKIDDLTTPKFIFLIHTIRVSYAKAFLDYEAVCTSFAMFLNVLIDHGLIKRNSMARVLSRPEFYDEYRG